VSQPKLINANPINDYKVLVVYETGERKIFDVKPYIIGDWFGKLKDKTFFDSVRVAGNTIQWADGQDIAPHELYDDSIPVLC
jgi:hypothetical protein